MFIAVCCLQLKRIKLNEYNTKDKWLCLQIPNKHFICKKKSYLTLQTSGVAICNMQSSNGHKTIEQRFNILERANIFSFFSNFSGNFG